MSYKILEKYVDTDDKKYYLIQLGKARLVREVGKQSYVKTDRVLYGSVKTEKHGEPYEETQLTAADDKGEIVEAIMYFGPRAFTVEEAMFVLGELDGGDNGI